MEPDDLKPTDDLAARRDRLSRALEKHASKSVECGGKTSGLGEAMKIASEFVAGIVVGVGLGLIFDHLVGTTPFGLIVFLMLGFAAGVLNVLRAQGRVADAGAQLRSDGAKAPVERMDRSDDDMKG
jgi:ATP synthase protein I